MNDKDLQRDELCALKSIYFEEFEYDENTNLPEGKFDALVALPDNFKIIWRTEREKVPELQMMVLEYLPPIILSFKLPEDYPSKSPPDFTLACEWLRLDQVGKLCKKLDDLWLENAGCEILFIWALFLKEETMGFLEISDTLDVSSLYSKLMRSDKDKRESLSKQTLTDDLKGMCGSGENEQGPDEGRCTVSESSGFKLEDVRAVCKGTAPIIERLVEYNEMKQRETFMHTLFECNICFLSVVGAECIQFRPCCHVFCQNCVKDYFEGLIRDGRVQNIQCPGVKCLSVAMPSQVKDTISAELFSVYDRLLLNATLDTMSDVIYCPVAACQYPVIRDPSDKMATCPVCRYVFCVYCKMVYHGIEPCRFRANEKLKLVKEYQSASPERKLELEQKYGKKQLKLLVDTTMSQEWIDTHSKHCPHCKVSIEKSDGCNKMSCWNCKTNFCWLCLTHLNKSNPYDHFTSPSSKCADMLFHGIRIDDEDDDDGGEDQLSDTEN